MTVLHSHEFVDALARKNIILHGTLIADGIIHRFSSGEKSEKDCWYVFYDSSSQDEVDSAACLWV